MRLKIQDFSRNKCSHYFGIWHHFKQEVRLLLVGLSFSILPSLCSRAFLVTYVLESGGGGMLWECDGDSDARLRETSGSLLSQCRTEAARRWETKGQRRRPALILFEGPSFPIPCLSLSIHAISPSLNLVISDAYRARRGGRRASLGLFAYALCLRSLLAQ